MALQIRQAVRVAIKDSDAFFMQRLFHPLQVSMDKIHMFPVSITRPDSQDVNPTPYGMAQVRGVLTGTEPVLGFKAEPNKALKTQVEQLMSLDSTALKSQVATKPNFGIKLSAGDLAVIPSGFVYIRFCPEETVSLAWAMSPQVSGEDDRVRHMLGCMLEATPALATTDYAALFDLYRQEATAAAPAAAA